MTRGFSIYAWFHSFKKGFHSSIGLLVITDAPFKSAFEFGNTMTLQCIRLVDMWRL